MPSACSGRKTTSLAAQIIKHGAATCSGTSSLRSQLRVQLRYQLMGPVKPVLANAFA